MDRIVGLDASQGDYVDVSYDPFTAWPVGGTDSDTVTDVFTEMRLIHLLFGDDVAGPYVALSNRPPMDEGGPKRYAHGHDTDSWRMPLRGQMSIGKTVYQAGDFRFQEGGGRPYGLGDLAWGVNGGWAVVMMGDRRGTQNRPTNPDNILDAEKTHAALRNLIGIDQPENPPRTSYLRSTLGLPLRGGQIDGSFSDAETWPELAPGVRVAIGLIGDPQMGPIVLLISSAPNVSVIEAGTFGTELLIIPVEGSCTIGRPGYVCGSVRLQRARTPFPGIAAGPEGFAGTFVFGDRRMAEFADMTGNTDANFWRSTVDDLSSQLVLS